MFLTDYIKIYEDALSAEFCDKIIQQFDGSLYRETVVATDEPRPNTNRRCIELNLSKDESMFELQKLMLIATEIASAKYQQDVSGIVIPEKFGCEHFRLTKYGPTDRFDYHVAVNSYSSARRFLSMMWFLNDGEAGAVFFPHFNLRIPPKKGRLLMFPATWMYPSIDEEPISKEKYVIETFLHYV